jgi:H+/Cl- antiporter ClcA
MAVAFAAPVSGMVFIAEESAANLGAPIYYRALAANCVTLLTFNVLAAAYNHGAAFWNSRCRACHLFTLNVCPFLRQTL